MIGFAWWKMAAAAIVLLVAGALWLNNGSSIENQHAIAQNNDINRSKVNTVAGNKNSVKSIVPVDQTPDTQAASADQHHAVQKKKLLNQRPVMFMKVKTNVSRMK